MSKENGGRDPPVTEALAELFALARELEALSRDDLAGLRMRQLVQIERARMDFERFREVLELEVSNLRTSLNQALAGLIEAHRTTSSTWDPFQFPPAYQRPSQNRKTRATERPYRSSPKAASREGMSSI